MAWRASEKWQLFSQLLYVWMPLPWKIKGWWFFNRGNFVITPHQTIWFKIIIYTIEANSLYMIPYPIMITKLFIFPHEDLGILDQVLVLYFFISVSFSSMSENCSSLVLWYCLMPVEPLPGSATRCMTPHFRLGFFFFLPSNVLILCWCL